MAGVLSYDISVILHIVSSLVQAEPLTASANTGNENGLAPWLNWIEQPPPKGQVAGSNPAGVTIGVADGASGSRH